MNMNKQISMANNKFSNSYFQINKFRFILTFLSGVILLPIQLARTEEIFLKCTGKFEINRGELIKPDWETSYITINLNGSRSYIIDKGINKEGRTFIKSNSYTITHRDNSNRIKAKYKVNREYGNYVVDYPQKSRTLIGTCQKSRG